jgi:hypothetical protein
MMHTTFPIMAALALLVGVSGCFFPFHDRRGDPQMHRDGRAYGESRHVEMERNEQDGNCWREGSSWVCRGGRD